MAHLLPLVIVAYASRVDRTIDPRTSPKSFTNNGIQFSTIRVRQWRTVKYSTESVLGVDVGGNERDLGGPCVAYASTFNDEDRRVWVFTEPRGKATACSTSYKSKAKSVACRAPTMNATYLQR